MFEEVAQSILNCTHEGKISLKGIQIRGLGKNNERQKPITRSVHLSLYKTNACHPLGWYGSGVERWRGNMQPKVSERNDNFFLCCKMYRLEEGGTGTPPPALAWPWSTTE